MASQIGRKRTYEEACEDQKDKQTAASSSNGTAPLNSATSQISQAPEQTFCKELLQVYYDRLFPYQDMFNWLSYFNDPTNTDPAINRKYWCHREFSFTLKDDIYVRYNSYKSMDAWKEDLRRKCPYKIDLGALFNVEPKRRAQLSSDKMVAEEKELVFDIDISDYDDVRTCCSGAGICTRCWPLMSCAVEVMEAALREDFGLKHLLWVFSGRRGIHCWSGDELVRKFDVQQRSALIDYLKLYEGNAMNRIKVDLNAEKTRGIHESLNRAYKICVGYFQSCSLIEQGVADSEEGIEFLTAQIRFPEIQREVEQGLRRLMDSEDYAAKWKVIEGVFSKYMAVAKKTKAISWTVIKANLYEVVFAYTYPRLDVEVSRHVNHLLKAPFCVHPKTGKVCSIIDPKEVKSFDPDNQPTLLGLVKEYNANTKGDAGAKEKSRKGWKNTSLREVVEVFRRTFLNDLEKECTAVIDQAKAKSSAGRW